MLAYLANWNVGPSDHPLRTAIPTTDASQDEIHCGSFCQQNGADFRNSADRRSLHRRALAGNRHVDTYPSDRHDGDGPSGVRGPHTLNPLARRAQDKHCPSPSGSQNQADCGGASEKATRRVPKMAARRTYLRSDFLARRASNAPSRPSESTARQFNDSGAGWADD